MADMQALQCEIAVIGCLLIEQKLLADIERAGIVADDFGDTTCQAIYRAALKLRDEGQRIDPVTVGAEAVRFGAAQDLTAWMHDTMETVPTLNNLAVYCGLVKRESKRRRLQALFDDAVMGVSYGDYTGAVETVMQGIGEICGGEVSGDIADGDALSVRFEDYYKRVKAHPGEAFCETGFDELDAQLGGGMFRSEVYIIGARPGMGKTTLGINIAEQVASNGRAVLFVSLEMTADQIMAKRIALCGLEYTRIMTGRLNADEEEQMEQTIAKIRERPFYLTTRSGLCVAEIQRLARQVRDLQLVIVDYLGLIAPNEGSQSKPKYEQMSEISAGIKALAKGLNVPVLALAQLNRENMQRKDKRPTMSDLRDSGAIEQDAGAIILLHRPEYYETHEPGVEVVTEDIELNVAKNRHHTPGMVRMAWSGGFGRIVSKGDAVMERKPEPVQLVDDEGGLPF